MSALIDRPVVLLDARDCAAIADFLERTLAAAVGRGEPVGEHVRRLVADVARLAELHRGVPVPPGTAKYRPVEPGGTEAVEWIPVDAAAEISGTSARNIRKRCVRGTLPARKVGSTWQVDRSALQAS